MTDQNINTAGRTLILPLTLLFSAVAVNHILSLLSYLIGGRPDPGLFRIILAAAYIAVSLFFWIVYRTGDNRMFHDLALAGCIVLIGITFYRYFFFGAAPGLSVTYRLIWIAADMPLVALYFLLKPYREPFRGDGERSADILPFLGVLHCLWGGLGFAAAILEIGHPDTRFLLRPALQIIVGLGILGRDRFFGLFGSFCLILLPFITQRPPFRISDTAGVVILMQRVLVPGTVFIILLLRKNEGFIRNTARYFFSDSASDTLKSCCSCGRQVPPAILAGQRCPHCGAFRSTHLSGRR